MNVPHHPSPRSCLAGRGRKFLVVVSRCTRELFSEECFHTDNRIRRTHGAMAVGVVLEDGFPAVAAIDDVINVARIFNGKFAGLE